jgi:signal transduction histidine kinase
MTAKAGAAPSSFTESSQLPSLFETGWPRVIAWTRVAVAAIAIGVSYWFTTGGETFYYGLLAIFLAYALVLALRGKQQSGVFGLLTLIADTVFFLIVASRGSGQLLWLAAAFFLFVLAEALVFYGSIEVGMITAVTAIFCGVLPYPELRTFERTVFVGGLLAFGFAMNRQGQTAQNTRMREQLEESKTAVEKAREQERLRIAADFHDGPLQSFISLQMRLEILRKVMERDLSAGMEDLRQLQALAQQQVRDLRVFLHSMRPVDVDGANFVATARRAAETFQKESGIPVTFMGSNTNIGLPADTTMEVLQMIREALANVQKHSGATRVAVAMDKTERGLEISIDDNGHGFNFAGTYSLEEMELLRLGPASLKRRARSLNAELVIESRPGRGSGIRFWIPLQ